MQSNECVVHHVSPLSFVQLYIQTLYIVFVGTTLRIDICTYSGKLLNYTQYPKLARITLLAEAQWCNAWLMEHCKFSLEM